ncbi:MAG: M48 family peptidase [Candidatus Nanohaloarchaea archaeon]|nr:M48 family peptidase [Candidatus Nanohaloarchaea archaeon]
MSSASVAGHAADGDVPEAFAEAEEQLASLVEAFRTGAVADAVEKSVLEPVDGDERPIDSWSLSNRLLCFMAGTEDARGYKQWQEVGRHVEAGADAVRILVPKTVTVEEEVEREDGTVETEETEKCVGFYAAPVFRVEDTEGEPLPDPDYAPPELPPLVDVAEAMGVAVSYDADRGRGAYGAFDPDAEEITLFTHDEQTFWHELAHAAHHRVSEGLAPGQDPEQEAVAELAAAVLARLYGAANEGYSFDYLQHYAAQDEAGDVYRLCLSVLGEVEAVLRYVLEMAEGT